MKGPRPISRILVTAFLLGGMAATIGCGPHPEEGMLKLPPRKAETIEASKPEPKKTSPASRKARRAAEEAAGGK